MGAGGEAAVQSIKLLDGAPRATVSVTGTLKGASPLDNAVAGLGHHCQSVQKIPLGRQVKATASTRPRFRDVAFLRDHAETIAALNAPRLRREAAILAAFEKTPASTKVPECNLAQRRRKA